MAVRAGALGDGGFIFRGLFEIAVIILFARAFLLLRETDRKGVSFVVNYSHLARCLKSSTEAIIVPADNVTNESPR